VVFVQQPKFEKKQKKQLLSVLLRSPLEKRKKRHQAQVLARRKGRGLDRRFIEIVLEGLLMWRN